MADAGARDGVLSPVSSADSKRSKSAVDRRVFERLSVSSVQYFAESLGYDTHYRKFFTIVSSDALCALTEDVNYRLRELIHKAVIFLRQRRGEKLTVGDVDEALRWSGANMLFGHRSREPPRLHFIKELNLFVPNEGVVDATSLALSDYRPPTAFAPSLTGHFLPSLFDKTNDASCEEDMRLKDVCSRILHRCLTCSNHQFNDNLARLREACTIHHRCNTVLLSQLVPWVLKSPSSARSWYCLREAIINARSFDADELRLVCQIADALTGLILRPEKKDSSSIPVTDFHFRLLASISQKYDYLSSSRFDQILLRKFRHPDLSSVPPSQLSRLLDAMVCAVNRKALFSQLDMIVDRFGQYANGRMDDSDLYFAWKRMIDLVLQHLIRFLPEQPSVIDKAISTLQLLSQEAFGNASPIPLMDFRSHASETLPVEPVDVKGLVAPPEIPRSGGQLLEDYWNASAKSENNEFSAVPTEEGNLVINSPRKRKRRREASDVFEFPKRLRLMHQRDIIFVFHRTQAVVRPLKTSVNSGPAGGMSRRDSNVDRRLDGFCAKVMKRGRSDRRRMLPSVVDVRTVVL